MTALSALEWISFGLGAATVWRYGYSKKQGASLGVITAFMFMFWGGYAGLWGAFTINIGFFFLHANNLKRALIDDV